jgi:N-acetylglucosaminyl-diphospho-decaprenol L-rhamnosyltransferase
VKFSAVIVNYASWALTVRCVESVLAAGHKDLEVTVVDNDTPQPPQLPPRVRLIRNAQNLGFARACNQGIAASSGDLVVLVNPDTSVKRDFFRLIETFFDENPTVGVAGPRILYPDGRLQLTARREVGLVSGLFGRTSLLTRLFPKSSLVKSQFPAVTDSTRPTPVDWVAGMCMILRRSTLEEIGPLDERFFMYFEDTDLCRRAREANWSVFYLPQIEVVHEVGASSYSKPKAIWLLHKSAFLYHRKHGAHGPLDILSLLVFLGLTGRALGKLAVWMVLTFLGKPDPHRKRSR